MQCVECKVNPSQVQLTDAKPSGQVFLGSLDFAYVIAGDGVVGKIVAGKGVEELGFVAPVFHHLRRHFDKIALHAGAAEAGIGAIGEKAVHGVSELVHKGLHLVETQQRRFVSNGFGEVAHHLNQRSNLFASYIALLAECGLPGTAALAGSRVHVQIEHTHETVAVHHLVNLHIGVVDFDVVGLAERDSIQAAVQVEDALPHFLHLQVGTQQLRVEVILLLLQFLAVVAEVPALQRKRGAELLCEVRYLGKVFFCERHGLTVEVGKEFGQLFGGVAHAVAQHILAVILIAQHLGLLVA